VQRVQRVQRVRRVRRVRRSGRACEMTRRGAQLAHPYGARLIRMVALFASRAKHTRKT